MHKRQRMGHRRRHCGMAATAAVVSLLAVSDVQGFAFSTLQLRALHGGPSSTSKQQQRQQQQEQQRQRGAMDGWRSTLSVQEAWSHRWAPLASSSALESRRGRTALRMVSEDLTSPVLVMASGGGSGSGSSSCGSGGVGGTAAAEAAPPETASGRGLVGAVGGKDIDGDTDEGDGEAGKLRLTAEKLKLQAERLRLEVEKEQLILQAEKLQEKEALEGRQDGIIEALRQKHGRDEELTVLVKSYIKKIDADFFMRLADVAEMSPDTEERDSLVALSEDVMRAVDKVDKARAVKVSKAIKETLDRTEEIERATRARAAAQALVQAQNASSNKSPSSEISVIATNITDILDLREAPSSKTKDLRNLVGIRTGDNSTLTVEGLTGMPDVMNVMLLPLWVPTSLLKFVGSAPALLDADIEAVKTEVLGMDTFYVTGVEKSPFAALFRGNMRGKSSEEVFEKITSKLDAIPGLADRVQLFLMGDPTPLTPEEAVQRRGKPLDPVLMVISKQAVPQTGSLLSVGGAAATLVGTAFTAFAYGIGNFALRPEFYQKINDGDTSVAALALPIMAGVLALQVVHELGHWGMASVKKIKMGLPVFIPSLQLGLFGAITPLLSFPNNRKQYFDIAAAGPLIGAIVSLGVFIAGIVFTGSATPEALEGFPIVPAGLFHSSLLVGIITSLGLPTVMTQAVTATIAVHPLAVVGFAGVIVNALNLMPIGSLDGGRIAMSTFGRKAGGVLGTLTLLLQAVSAVFNNYSLQLFWGLLVILFQRGQDLPAKDELTEVDEGRMLLTFLLLAYSLITLIPFPGTF